MLPDEPAGDDSPQPAARNHPLGTAGMIVGIVAIPLAICLAPLGILAGIVGAVLGLLGLRKVSEGEAGNRGMALTGVITGAVAIVVGIVSWVLAGLLLG